MKDILIEVTSWLFGILILEAINGIEHLTEVIKCVVKGDKMTGAWQKSFNGRMESEMAVDLTKIY